MDKEAYLQTLKTINLRPKFRSPEKPSQILMERKIEKANLFFSPRSNMKITINVYGEAHFVRKEVEEVRKKILGSTPDVILLENYDDDKDYYAKNSKAEVKRLEPEFQRKTMSILKQFELRENMMIKSILQILAKISNNEVKDNQYVIAIQIGDTHLRTIHTKELGIPIFSNFLNSLNRKNVKVNIFRSKHGEIK